MVVSSLVEEAVVVQISKKLSIQSHKLRHFAIMQVDNEKQVVFWDRLERLDRKKKEDGETVQRGSIGGSNILRIREGEKDRGYFLTVTCVMQQVLIANIAQWPSAVLDEGRSIKIWFFDHALGQDGNKREFTLSFFDEYGAKKFFESYTSCLPKKQRKRGGKSFDALLHGATEGDRAGSGKNGGMKEEDDVGIKASGEKKEGIDDGDGNSTGKKKRKRDEAEVERDNNKDGDDDDEHQAKIQRIMEMEDNWGESQSLFQPHYPDEI